VGGGWWVLSLQPKHQPLSRKFVREVTPAGVDAGLKAYQRTTKASNFIRKGRAYCALHVAELAGEIYLTVQFATRTYGKLEVMGQASRSAPPTAFGDVRADRHCSAPHLRGQTESLRCRKPRGGSIDLNCKCLRFVPNPKLPKVLHVPRNTMCLMQGEAPRSGTAMSASLWRALETHHSQLTTHNSPLTTHHLQ
jgi:hypothetical protein